MASKTAASKTATDKEPALFVLTFVDGQSVNIRADACDAGEETHSYFVRITCEGKTVALVAKSEFRSLISCDATHPARRERRTGP